jgi:hypothetical protein
VKAISSPSSLIVFRFVFPGDGHIGLLWIDQQTFALTSSVCHV